MPIAIVGGRTRRVAWPANLPSAETKSGDAPLNGTGGEARMAAPIVANRAVSSCATAISAMVERTRSRRTPSMPAPSAIPMRNRVRMIVNTYVELPVPAPMSRFQTTW